MREKKDISYTIRRSADFPVIMIGEGILVGCFAGGVVLLYRICLNYAASSGCRRFWDFAKDIQEEQLSG